MAIISGEPGGLATAIEFSKLDWKLYENLKPAISEIDTGIMVRRNTWRMFDMIGAARHFSIKDFFRIDDVNGHYQEHPWLVTIQLIHIFRLNDKKRLHPILENSFSDKTGIDERLVIQGLDSVLHDNKARRSNENQGHQPRCNVLAQD
ncbi:hypothetical protein M434DRAFT_34442 [Hypoxylon sp. CO27-5]|nr:hypothetical protein M434DRAFT_34442 [Hypoxylon sp. CO27-5]